MPPVRPLALAISVLASLLPGRGEKPPAADDLDFRTKTNVAVTTEAEGKCDFPSLAFDGEVLGVCYEAAAGVTFRRLGR